MGSLLAARREVARQRLVIGAAVRGRVMALYLAIFMGGTPVGAPMLGWIAERYGARWTMVGGGALTMLGTLIATAVFARSQNMRLWPPPE